MKFSFDFSLGVLLILVCCFSISLSQDCKDYVSRFGCASIISCQETSGVCQCANGNQCSWNLEGAQATNCPCFDSGSGYTPFNASDYCITQFTTNNCGYESACNENGLVGSCVCPDGQSSCIWSGSNSLGCPCTGSFISLASYRNLKFQECSHLVNGYKCDPEGIINCVGNSGSCTCKDGSLCAWSDNYVKNCPCN